MVTIRGSKVKAYFSSSTHASPGTCSGPISRRFTPVARPCLSWKPCQSPSLLDDLHATCAVGERSEKFSIKVQPAIIPEMNALYDGTIQERVHVCH